MAASPSAASDLAGPAEPHLEGRLEADGRAWPVTVAAATRLSFHVSFQEGPLPPDGAAFEALVLAADAGEVRLRRCRFHLDPGRHGHDGRLVFLDDVHDVGVLLADGTVTSLEAAFHNLPLVLAQRERIRPEFKAFLADAIYDLSVYKRFFDEQEALIATEPVEVAAAARGALVRAEQPRFFAFMEDHLRRLEALVREYRKEEYDRHGFYLRRLAWPYILPTPFIARSNLKPRGYAGDAESMVFIYEDRYEGSTAFHQLLHKHAVNTAAAKAVRARRRLVPRVLRDVRARFGDLGRHGFGFLSVASGPASELEDVLAGRQDLDRLQCTLLDQDAFAIDIARRTVARVEARAGGKAKVRYVQDSVRTMLRDRDLAERLGRHHFVYSMGLFDYLTPPVARAVLARLFDLLVPGGTLLIGNFHESNASRVYMDYWGDWPLYYRSEGAFLSLAEGLEGTTSLSYDETGAQMFLRIERPG
jgi:extracellular factor (EF) 3-hydroxypalmitic acid methyl ester biosynthesis protein